MLSEQLVNLIEDVIAKKCELQNVEFKKASGGTPEKLYDTLSSFSNQTGGGVIIFGVEEKKGFAVMGVHDAQEIQVKVTNQALQMNPVVRPVFTVADINGKTVVSAEISECDIYEKPCFYIGAGRMRGSYVRVGESDQPMTEYEIYSYEVFKRKIQDELRIVERADMESFDKNSLAEYFIKLRKTKQNLAKQSDEKIMRLQGLIEKDKPTVAGIMLLGEYPQAFFPQLSVTAMVVPGIEFGVVGENDERFLDNKRIEGTISQMLEDTIAFVRRNTRNATIVDDSGKRNDRPDYPMKAVREIVLNALVHRDYSIHTDNSPVRVVIYDDRLEVENPGGLYGRITVDQLGKMSADTRNPFIAGGLEILIDTENRFSGIPTVYHEMELAGLRPPVFENRRGVFKVTLFKEQQNKTNVVDEEERFTQSDSDVNKKILTYCEKPRSRFDLANELGYDSTYYMVTKYLRPLVESGKLKMVLPNRPRSKNQKYVTENYTGV